MIVLIGDNQYTVPKFTFGNICKLEELGMEFSKADKRIFSNLLPLVALTTNKNIKEAAELIENNPKQFNEVSKVLFTALGESDFFRQMAEQETQQE